MKVSFLDAFLIGAMIAYAFLYLRKINRKLDLVLASLTPIKEARIIQFYAFIDGKKTKVDEMFLKVSQSLPLSIEIKDKFGNLAAVDGVPEWAVSDPSLAKLNVAADGMSAEVVPLGPVGAMKVQVSADADLGAGVVSILGELDVDLLPGQAVSIAVSAGAPVDLP